MRYLIWIYAANLAVIMLGSCEEKEQLKSRAHFITAVTMYIEDLPFLYSQILPFRCGVYNRRHINYLFKTKMVLYLGYIGSLFS